MKKTTYINSNLYDGTLNMTLQKGVSIEVSDNVITRIGNFEVDKNSKIVDLNGMFVTPGLINLHAHLPSSGKLSKGKLGDKTKLVKFVSKNPIGRVIGNMLVKSSASKALNAGVTTIRAVGGVSDFDSILRDKINAHKIIGPRLFVCNCAIGVKGGHMDGTVARAIETKEEVLSRIEELESQNVDFIKLMITGGVLDGEVPGHPAPLRMSKELVEACVKEAHSRNIKVCAHVESPDGMKIAIECGVDSIEHGSAFDKSLIPQMKKNGQAVVTTFEAAAPFIELDKEVHGYGDVAKINSEIVLKGMIDACKMCIDNGIQIGLGTDAGSTLVSHYNFYKELILFEKHLKVSKSFALYSATLGNAKVLKKENEIGSVEVNKKADFIIMKKDPLDDLHALGDIKMVVVDGVLIKKPKFKRDKKLDSLIDPII